MNLANCKLCGMVFAKGMTSYCPTCQAKLDDRYDEFRDFVKKHPGCTVMDVANVTGIPVNYVQQYNKDEYSPSPSRKRKSF